MKQKGLTLVELIVIITIIIIMVFVVATIGRAHADNGSSSCGGWFEPSCGSSTSLQQNQQQSVTDAVNKLITAVPAPQIQNSLERTNISKRLVLFSDPNKVSYIYLVSYGKVMAFYTIKGKITSGSKRLTSSQNQVDSQNCGGASNCTSIMEAPELDGTYGNSNPYIFFWTTDGVYVQWSGDYMLVDQPLQLTNQPEMVRQVK